MHALIQKHREAIGALCHQYGVRRLEVFGSAARGDDFDQERSDVDFLLEIDPDREPAFSMRDYLDFRDALSELLGRPVDFVFAESIRNPYIQAEIDRHREVVHAA
jgi:predicted nucleotidyltransferase